VSEAYSDLSDFLREFWGEGGPLRDDADVFDCLGIEGDDAFDFIDRFAAGFGVDVNDYRWYFHHGEEGWNLGGLFFRPPNGRVDRMPITPVILTEAIRSKRWPVRYPDHWLPRVRWDIRLNRGLAILPFVFLALWIWARLVR
jgi:hypothetical protein